MLGSDLTTPAIRLGACSGPGRAAPVVSLGACSGPGRAAPVIRMGTMLGSDLTTPAIRLGASLASLGAGQVGTYMGGLGPLPIKKARAPNTLKTS